MPAQPQTLALVTGSTQGIGLQVAKVLASEHSYHVIFGVRDVRKGEDIASDLRRQGHSASVVELDLSSQSSVEAAVATISRDYGYLDVLVNNAAILIDYDTSKSRWDLYNKTFSTNVIGTGVLTEGLEPLLRKARAGPPRIVFVSSIMGSLEVSKDKSTPWYNADYRIYDASKAALNILMLNSAHFLEDVGAKVNSVCPGYINSNLTRYDKTAESVEVGAIQIVKMATVGHDGPSGTFSNRQGPIAW